MNFIGRLFPPKRPGKFWEVSIPDLSIFTQGRSRTDAYAMALDAIKTVVLPDPLNIELYPLAGGRFLVAADNPTPLIARWLCHLRVKNHLTIRQAAERLGGKSPEAWARYESGRASPTIAKLCELITAVEPETKMAFKQISLTSLKKAI